MTYSGPDYRQALSTLFTDSKAVSNPKDRSKAESSVQTPILASSITGALSGAITGSGSGFGHALIWPMSGLVLAACGSSGGDDKVSVSGQVLDGPVKNAKVYVDVDGNGKLDTKTDKLIGTTDAQGRFSARIDQKYQHMTLLADLTGATDINNPADWSDDAPTPAVVLRAPAGSKVISPFTEMVVRIMKDPQTVNQPVSAQQAMEILAENLGVSKSINFLTLDHTIALSDAGAAGLSNADAEKLKLLAPQLTYFLQNQTGANDLNVAVSKNQIAAMASNQKPVTSNDIQDSGKGNDSLPLYYGFEFQLKTAKGNLSTAFNDPEKGTLTYRVEVLQNGEVKTIQQAFGNKVSFDASSMSLKAEQGWSHANADAVKDSDATSYTLKVTAIDPYGRTASQEVMLYFSKNQPVEISQDGTLSKTLITEGNAISANDTGLSFTGSDGDGDNTKIKWSLAGDWASYFELENATGASAGKLKVKAQNASDNKIDFETNPKITVTVVATDDRGAQTRQDVIVDITDKNEAPTITVAANITSGVVEDTAYQLTENVLKASDPDKDDEPVYSFKGFTTANAATTDNKLQLYNGTSWVDLAVNGTFTQKQVKDGYVRLIIGDNQARDTKLILTLADKSGLAGSGDPVNQDGNIVIEVKNIVNVPDLGASGKAVNTGAASSSYNLAATDIKFTDGTENWHSLEISGLPNANTNTTLYFNDNGVWKKIVDGTAGTNEITLSNVGKIASADIGKLRFSPDSDYQPSSSTNPSFAFKLYRSAEDKNPATGVFSLDVNYVATAKGAVADQFATASVAYNGPDMDGYFTDEIKTDTTDTLDGGFAVSVAGPNSATSLPAGISFNTTTHVFAGTGTATTGYGTYTVTVTYTDANHKGAGNAAIVTQSFKLHYLEAGTTGNDTKAAATFYNGQAGNDTITGGAGNDILFGGAGTDSITGGAGDDLIHGGAGADTLTGGTGTDTASYAGGTAGVNVDLNGQHQVSWTAVANLKGSDLAAGDAGKYIIASLANSVWTVTLGTTNETASATKLVLGKLSNTGLALDTGFTNDGAISITGTTLSIATSNRGKGEALGDLLNGIENLIGGAGADGLTGGAGADTLTGGAGNDVFDVGNVAGTRAAADIIKDFTEGDTIKLGGDQQVYWKASGSDTILYNSNSVGTSNILAVLEGYSGGLDASDFTDITNNNGVVEIA
ncbi:MAG: putative Ig domain-containing protein [Candidatus Puniceispirillaceae bacterium]